MTKKILSKRFQMRITPEDYRRIGLIKDRVKLSNYLRERLKYILKRRLGE